MITRTNPPADYIDQAVFDAFSYSQTVSWNGLYFFAGLAPIRGSLETIELVGEGDIGAQISHCLAALDSFLGAEQLGRANILSWTFYTTDMAGLVAQMPLLVGPWVGEHKPANTIVEVSGFVIPGQLIEITPVAAR